MFQFKSQILIFYNIYISNLILTFDLLFYRKLPKDSHNLHSQHFIYFEFRFHCMAQSILQ